MTGVDPVRSGHRLRSGLLVAVVAGVVVIGSGDPAAAAVPISEQGKTGTYVIVDTEARPGVTCMYDAGGGGAQGNDIDIMEARGPRIFARDRSSRRDRQAVGVRFIFQRSVNEGGTGGWQAAKTTSMQKKTASDDQPAVFGKRSWLVPIEEDVHFRTVVILTWFKPGSTTRIQGTAKLRFVHYLVEWAGAPFVEQDRCLPEP